MMTDNIVQFPTAYEPEQPQPNVVRIMLPEPPKPYLGWLVAVVCGVASFVMVTALLS
jgi:hypothetical protein